MSREQGEILREEISMRREIDKVSQRKRWRQSRTGRYREK